LIQNIKNEGSANQFTTSDSVSEQFGRYLITLEPVDHGIMFLIKENVARVIAD